MITRKSQQYCTPSSESGFTIIESLIAIVVVGILMTAIAPVIVLSVATRVQARRVEIASQAAQTYIDGIKSGAITIPSHTVTLDEIDETKPRSQQFTSQRETFSGVAAPTSSGSLNCSTNTTGYPYCSNTSTLSLYCNDLDGGGCSSGSNKDLLVQAFRSATPSSTNIDKGYILGLRVYRANAFSDSTSLVKSEPNIKRTEATFTGGMGNRKAPLMETTTEIRTDKTTFRDLCDRFGGC